MGVIEEWEWRELRCVLEKKWCNGLNYVGEGEMELFL